MQKRLAELLGVTETNASIQLRGKLKSGTPRYVIAMLVAWEMFTHEQRLDWLAEIKKVEAELAKRK